MKDNMKEIFDNIEVPKEVPIAIAEGIKRGKKYKKQSMIKITSNIAACFIVGVFTFTMLKPLYGTIPKKPQENTPKVVNDELFLPVVGTLDNYKNLIEDYYKDYPLVQNDGIYNDGIYNDATKKGASGKEYSIDYSKTNNQVQGIDEGDVVKTDGKYIYKLVNGLYNFNRDEGQKIYIVKANPAENMDIVSSVALGKDYQARELFLYKDKLIVIGITGFNNSNNLKTSLKIYDIKDRSKINFIKEINIDGAYNSGRLINSKLFFVSTAGIPKDNEFKPGIYDSKFGARLIDYKDILYLPECIQPQYTMVGTCNLDEIDKEAKVETILGGGGRIYCSLDNLYIAGTKYDKDNKKILSEIYRFSIEGGSAKFTGSGEVSGNVLNQFSMDEKDGKLRLATTNNKLWNNSQSVLSNNIYILDKDMKIAGKLENIQEGEKIYSVRFMGDRAYVVTFMLTDPLMVIDLKDSTKPKIIGELKIPGFSSYLHPYDETHLIGFGFDTETVKEYGEDFALRKGMKVALFDVSDVEHPIQKFVQIIGDKGTDSDLIFDHKALLFSKDKGIVAFPVNVVENNNGTFQGAYIYDIDINKGLTLKGKITHIETDRNGYFISRILYINDNIYTISDRMIKSNKIKDLSEIKKVNLK